MSLVDAEAWADFLERRSDGLRAKGILSIGCGPHSAVLAPAEPAGDNADNAAGFKDEEDDESPNAWENGSSYPSGHVPSLTVDPEELPDIPTFGESR